eukprot:11842972-Karenia_brevis.AAC.1
MQIWKKTSKNVPINSTSGRICTESYQGTVGFSCMCVYIYTSNDTPDNNPMMLIKGMKIIKGGAGGGDHEGADDDYEGA